ncbi:MAG: condensation domain-containing protein, partial [Candidatus Methylumidiphilus sp.]
MFPASIAQHRQWVMGKLVDKVYPSAAIRVERIQGVLNVDVLEAALNALLARHEALRTCYVEHDGILMQLIQPRSELHLTLVDLRSPENNQREWDLSLLIQQYALMDFDLGKPPLLRFQLLQLGDTDYIFLLAIHHLIADAWSVNVIIRELSDLYQAFSQGSSTPLPELTVHYSDFAHRQWEWMNGDSIEKLFDYWKTRLADLPTVELPTDRRRPAVQSYLGKTMPFEVSPELALELKNLSQREGVSLSMTLTAALLTLLHRYSGQEDLVIGTLSSGRRQVGYEGLIGQLANILLLRSTVSAEMSFRELLTHVRETTIGAYDNQDMPYAKLVQALHPNTDLSRNPLFQVMFIFRDAPDATLHLNGMVTEPLSIETLPTPYDLTLELTESRHRLYGKLSYATDLFEPASIDRLIGHYLTLLEGIVANPAAHLFELPLLTNHERQQMLLDWNDTTVEYPHDRFIHEMFEEQVERTPEEIENKVKPTWV